MSLRFDPTHSADQIAASLRQAAEAAWGPDSLPEIESAVEISARALWRISQEPLEPADVEP
jgi:hypothetical protein